MSYHVTIDKNACTGIFACLVRDDRFVEDEDGLATLDAEISHEGNKIVATFEDGIEQARAAEAACPPGAITITEQTDETEDPCQ